jgi:tetrahydromethanopterin S-methyltransferase subunit G
MSVLPLRAERGVADVLNVSFRFVRAYWRILLKSLLYLLVPPVVVGYGIFAAVGLEGIMTYFLDPQAIVQGKVSDTMLVGLGAGGAVASLLSFVGSALGMTAVLAVVRLHEEEGPEHVTFDRVLDHTKQRFGRVLGTQLGVTVALVVGAVIVLIPCLGALAYLAGLVFVSVRYLFLTIPIQVLADESFFGSFRRAGTVSKGRFWPTAGVALLTFVVVFVLSGVFTLPVQVIRFLGDFHATGGYPGWLKALFAGLLVLSNAGSVVSVTMQAVAGGVQYYNLEEQTWETSIEQQVQALERDLEASEGREGEGREGGKGKKRETDDDEQTTDD